MAHPVCLFARCCSVNGTGQNHNRIPSSDSNASRTEFVSPFLFNDEKLDQTERENIISSYFQPTMKRANELLSQSSKLDANKVINSWKDYARRNKSTESLTQQDSPIKNDPFTLSSTSSGGLNNLWSNECSSNTDNFLKKPLRLEALPNIVKNRRGLNTMEFL